ncbi:MAG: DUF2459 domain-containing protein [Planctomycetes bacterium]|nr:DUF2459 domain-containing protein [Planctomycetota bacterium]
MAEWLRTAREPAVVRRALASPAAAAAILVLGLGLSGCFPGPVRELWPPRPGEPRHAIDVAFRDWHTVIVEPAGGGAFREWESCEKAWYLEGRMGSSGAARALLWPTASGVACRITRSPVWQRYPSEEVERWTFVLSEKGLAALRACLEAEKGAPLAEHPGWHEGKRSYHLFYDCHHFTARALREAGLPIRPWWCFAGWQIRLQLDRVRRWHEREGGGAPR